VADTGRAAASEVPAIEPVEQLTLAPIRPRAGWYALGGLVIAAGLLGGFLLLTAGAFGYLRAVGDLVRVDAGREESVRLPAGEIVVYHEPDRVLAGAAELGLVVSVDGTPVALQPSEGDDYAVDARQGWEVARFRLDEAAAVDVATTAGDGQLALGLEPGRDLTGYGIGALVLAGVALVVGVVVLVVVSRRRSAATAERLATQQATHVPRLG
jgi:hypothetical protein